MAVGIMDRGQEATLMLGAGYQYISGKHKETVRNGLRHLSRIQDDEGCFGPRGELLDHLPRAGTAVINADDKHCADWRARSQAEKVISFGLGNGADCKVNGEIVVEPEGSRFKLQLPEGTELQMQLPLRADTMY